MEKQDLKSKMKGGVTMENLWMKPAMTAVSVNAECTAYSDTETDGVLF
jgi:hypothetical protein